MKQFRQLKQRLISFILALVMTVCSVPATPLTAWAAEPAAQSFEEAVKGTDGAGTLTAKLTLSHYNSSTKKTTTKELVGGNTDPYTVYNGDTLTIALSWLISNTTDMNAPCTYEYQLPVDNINWLDGTELQYGNLIDGSDVLGTFTLSADGKITLNLNYSPSFGESG